MLAASLKLSRRGEARISAWLGLGLALRLGLRSVARVRARVRVGVRGANLSLQPIRRRRRRAGPPHARSHPARQCAHERHPRRGR